MSKLTYKEVWDTLSKVDCNEQKQEKMGLSYLSWAWAWGILMEHYPESRYEFTLTEKSDGTMSDVLQYSDGTCQVECTIRIGELYRTMWLPVMDYKNNAISNPSARAISDTKMRCLVKCIGILGLGLYIYAGEDFPDKGKEKASDIKDIPKKTESAKQVKREKLLAYIVENKSHEVFASKEARESIDTFLGNVDDSTHIDALINYKKRMETAIKTKENK